MHVSKTLVYILTGCTLALLVVAQTAVELGCLIAEGHTCLSALQHTQTLWCCYISDLILFGDIFWRVRNFEPEIFETRQRSV